MTATVLRVVVSEAEIALHVPRGLAAPTEDDRILALRASDIDAKLESNTTGHQETALILAIMDAEFCDRSDPKSSSRLFGRTTPLSLTNHIQPLVQLRYSSLTNAITGTKETGIKVACSSITLFVTIDTSWVKELALFAKTPEGVFEDVVPSEMTRMNVALNDCSIHVSAPTMPGAIVAVLGVLDVTTVMVSDAEENVVKLGISSSHLLVVDDLEVVGPLESGHVNSVEAWKVGHVGED